MIFNAFVLALRQIRRNFLRAFLTMLGVIIGVGAVVTMISLGNGVTKQTSDTFTSLGRNIILVFPARAMNLGGSNLRRNFTAQEVKELNERMRGYVAAIAPISQSSTLLQFQSQNTTTQVQGVDKHFFEVTQWDSAQGRVFEDNEYKVGSNVCVIGESVRKNLFREKNPLGTKIRLSNIVCECVGVLESKGQGGMGNDQDDVLLLPMKTFSRSISGNTTMNNYSRIMIRTQDNQDSLEVNLALQNALRKIRNVKPGERDSFEIMDTKQIAQAFASNIQVLTMFLGLVAGVSLLVGGIGIMNIMLVSVTERTKEIGTRMAIGALQSEVLLQFLIEAVTLSALGGIMGIILAFFGSLGFAYAKDLPFIFDIPTAIIAFLFSVFIGVLFGYLPARRASRLNPIEALRHE
ncbi:ABC transporter permease [Helicobacter equorum]|uniref:Multidrug ABC transporter substrate-binding protein n=1 Tax=Helicobacter equorum TaxID=361872 RepID=A0A3D8IL19_9HELI|nr:ABC transporter permease [Helicobacter equorum]MDD7346228.1 ABC transporter permease [Helicobacter sp.]RDU66037.1 multidrug ABC transporter substrate-binding protein [Helicobacter equorum]